LLTIKSLITKMCFLLQANRNQLHFEVDFFFPSSKTQLAERAWSKRGGNGSHCGAEVVSTS